MTDSAITLHEGALTFTFPAIGKASQYDNWAHYRQQFNQAFGGTKAVDFLYVAEQTAWLIEVKDYRVHPRTKTLDLAAEVALKVRDTLAGLVSAQCAANNPEEKKVAREVLRCHTLRVVLHLEQPQKQSRLRPRAIEPKDVLMKLKQLIKAIDPHPCVVDQVSLSGKVAWQVQG